MADDSVTEDTNPEQPQRGVNAFDLIATSIKLSKTTVRADNVRRWWDALREHPSLVADLAAMRACTIDIAAGQLAAMNLFCTTDPDKRRFAVAHILARTADDHLNEIRDIVIPAADAPRAAQQISLNRMNFADLAVRQAPCTYPNLHTVSPNLHRDDVLTIFRCTLLNARNATTEGILDAWAESGDDLAGALGHPDIMGESIWGELWTSEPHCEGVPGLKEYLGGSTGLSLPRHDNPPPTLVLTLWPGAAKASAQKVFDELWAAAEGRIEKQRGRRGKRKTVTKDYGALVGIYRHHLEWSQSHEYAGLADFHRMLDANPAAAASYWPALVLGDHAARYMRIERKLQDARNWLKREPESDSC